MGHNATGILAYGFDLGDDFGFDWNDESPRPAWMIDPESEDGDEVDDLQETAKRALLAANGFTEIYEDGIEGYSSREREAESALGVEFVASGSEDSSIYILAAKVQEAEWGGADEVDLTLPDNADERLAWAVAVLGITPKAEKPAWLLGAYWG